MTNNPKVHVIRNPMWKFGTKGDEGKPWFVSCDFCGGGADLSFIAALTFAFGGPGRLGWAPTWRAAQDYAANHALRHEETRCPTCLHVPAEKIPMEATA